jgi:hypothetical protein
MLYQLLTTTGYKLQLKQWNYRMLRDDLGFQNFLLLTDNEGAHDKKQCV